MYEIGIETSVPFFGWTPSEAVRIADDIYRSVTTDWEREIFDRLMYADQMRFVWKEILAENHQTGGWVHPVVGGSISVFGPKLAQERACGEVFNLAYCAARDRIEACKWIEIEAPQKQWLAEAAEFRRVADKLAANGLRDPDASAGAALH
jgi:hypothetical protein